jgi:Na+/proline symporter/nitrogen-specific signal transduction histidine kinase
MLSTDLVIATAVGYVGLLFLIAYVGDRMTRSGKGAILRSPFVYTLSISVYCTSWTFYGAVGSAARNGVEYLAIYIGPTLVFIGWWFVLRRLVRIAHEQRITSIADLLSSRFGKSSRLAVLVTIVAVIAIAPYIALQLKAVTTSIQAITAARDQIDELTLALGVTVCMAVFTILFGTRNVDAKEQHHGVVAAIAFEAIVKLAALISVGVFVIYIGGGFESIVNEAEAAGVAIYSSQTFGERWVAMNVLAVAAIICLPRQFQVTVVENSNETHLRTASWAFPAYMLAMSLFTLPIALFGLTTPAAGTNPDMFVLTLPLSAGQEGLALFAFIGGFSSATSMIILESIALSIMVSNHIVMPIVLRLAPSGANDGRGVSSLVLNTRRLSIVLILFLGFGYFYLTRGSDALAPIGLISFTGVAQFLPAILAALFWRDASTKAAIAAVSVGFVIWAWSSFMPSFENSSALVALIMAEGPWGISWLRPQALFGLVGLDPLVHAVFWSLFLNTVVLVVGSLVTRQSALEQLQAVLFTESQRGSGASGAALLRGSATADDLFFVAQRVLGEERARAIFAAEADLGGTGVEPSPAFIGRLERELAGSIGAASAHVMLSKVVSGGAISIEEVLQMADETQQAIEYSQELEQTSRKLRATAEQLEVANSQLRLIDQQKDEFLSQVSHEVRTPMTAIRAFSEILLTERDLKPAERTRFVSTIHQESQRLTKLLDEILDLSSLERGERERQSQPFAPDTEVARALDVCGALAHQRNVSLESDLGGGGAEILGDASWLRQVVINLVTNAIKYNDAAEPRVGLRTWTEPNRYVIEVADNGPGIPEDQRSRIFEKFVRARTASSSTQPGAGLGLAISRELTQQMGGTLDLLEAPGSGACFRLSFERVQPILSANAAW